MQGLNSSLINEVILGVTAFVLLSGSAGLLLVSWSSPLLRGLVWVSGSFLLGGVGALLLAAHAHVPLWASAGGADLLTLGAFVVLDLAVRAVHSETPRIGRLSYGLLILQVVLCAPTMFGAGRLRAFGTAALLAAQACASGWALLHHRREGSRAPALLCGYLLFGYAALRTVQGAAIDSGWLRDSVFRVELDTAIAMITLALILGVAFGFFWMTTSVFANGLERMASTDPLTRIFNRRTFLLWCEKEIGRSLVSGTPFSLLLLDLDHFKRVNDRFGHTVGDRLLCSVVERVQDAVRGIDVVARWGGEEFAVLLPRASSEAAYLVAERVRGSIERSSLQLSEAEAHGYANLLDTTASVGAATFRGPGDTLNALFERADKALYAAKRRGRNCTVSSSTGSAPRSPEASPPRDIPAGVLEEQQATSPELVM